MVMVRPGVRRRRRRERTGRAVHVHLGRGCGRRTPVVRRVMAAVTAAAHGRRLQRRCRGRRTDRHRRRGRAAAAAAG